MSPSTPSATAPAASPHHMTRGRWLLLLVSMATVGLMWHGPIAQWPGYHHFADARPWLSLPNAANVLSNLPFAWIGLWAAWRLVQMPVAQRGTAHSAWLAFAAAVALTALGSSLYHWAPENTSLMFDRLPIAWACASLSCAFLAERVHPRWANLGALLPALAFATLAVVGWWVGESMGRGDLRAYLWVQFLPMLLVPAVLLMRLPALSTRAVTGGVWWCVLALYAAAKATELADHTLFDALAFTSGHTLKHLLAAAAAGLLVRRVTLAR